MRNLLLNLKNQGIILIVFTIIKKIKQLIYYSIYKRIELNKGQLIYQRKFNFNYSPLISVVCPLYNTNTQFLTDMIQSVLNQTYCNLELCLADASDSTYTLDKLVNSYNDGRIKYIKLNGNLGISENTNKAIELANGDFIAFIDHDDVIELNALFEVVRIINNYPDIDFIYTDEDNFIKTMKSRTAPFFKPNFSQDYLFSMNYICHFTVVKRKLLNKAGYLRKQFDGAQDYDFILRCTHNAKQIVHIPIVLYHWRRHKGSVSQNIKAKQYAWNAGKNALINYFKENVPEHKVSVINLSQPGRYKPIYEIKKTKLSVIIYNTIENNSKLKQYLLNQNITNFDYEIIIVGKPCNDINYVNVLTNGFTLFKSLNTGASNASGDFLLFLNSEVKLNNDYITEVLQYAQRKNTGAATGVILNASSKRIVSAGISLCGKAKHLMVGTPAKSKGYYQAAELLHNVSAASYCGMITSKKIFNTLGGFNDNIYNSSYADIDYCLRLHEKDYCITLNPIAKIISNNASHLSFNSKDKINFCKKYNKNLKDFYYENNPFIW